MRWLFLLRPRRAHFQQNLSFRSIYLKVARFPDLGAVLASRYLQKEFRVVRVKNRFESDAVEAVSVELLQAEFYAAETLGEDAESSASGASGSGSASSCSLHLEFPSYALAENIASALPSAFLRISGNTRWAVQADTAASLAPGIRQSIAFESRLTGPLIPRSCIHTFRPSVDW